jgi:hypothetical protein
MFDLTNGVETPNLTQDKEVPVGPGMGTTGVNAIGSRRSLTRARRGCRGLPDEGLVGGRLPGRNVPYSQLGRPGVVTASLRIDCSDRGSS